MHPLAVVASHCTSNSSVEQQNGCFQELSFLTHEPSIVASSSVSYDSSSNTCSCINNSRAISEETLAIESLMSMRKQNPSMVTSASTLSASFTNETSVLEMPTQVPKVKVVSLPEPPVGPSEEELAELKTSRSKSALRSWYRRLNELYQFKLKYGHCDVPQKYPENRCLGIWVNKQRCEKVMWEENADHKTIFTPQKLYHLERIGFVWAKRKGDVIWNQRYNELYEFYKEHGHSDLPCKYRPKPTLGRWVTSQRSMFKRGTLHQEYVKKLDEIGFTWDMYAKNNDEDGEGGEGEGESSAVVSLSGGGDQHNDDESAGDYHANLSSDDSDEKVDNNGNISSKKEKNKMNRKQDQNCGTYNQKTGSIVATSSLVGKHDRCEGASSNSSVVSGSDQEKKSSSPSAKQNIGKRKDSILHDANKINHLMGSNSEDTVGVHNTRSQVTKRSNVTNVHAYGKEKKKRRLIEQKCIDPNKMKSETIGANEHLPIERSSNGKNKANNNSKRKLEQKRESGAVTEVTDDDEVSYVVCNAMVISEI